MAETVSGFPDAHDLDFMVGKQVLLVDDEPDILASMQRILTAGLPGLEIHLAATGEEAVDLIDGQEFDIVITDFRLPEKDGLAVLEHARTQQPFTPRIFVSAFADLDMALAAINDAGVNAVMTKPLDTHKFVYQVNDLLVERHMME